MRNKVVIPVITGKVGIEKDYDDLNIIVRELLNEFQSIKHHTWRWIELNNLFQSVDNLYDELYNKVLDVRQ